MELRKQSDVQLTLVAESPARLSPEGERDLVAALADLLLAVAIANDEALMAEDANDREDR